MHIARAAPILALLIVCGCDPGYERTVRLTLPDDSRAGQSLDSSRGNALRVVGEVADAWGFRRDPDNENPLNRARYGAYFAQYQPDPRSNSWRRMAIKVDVPADNPQDERQLEIVVSEFVASRESQRFRGVFGDLKRRLIEAFGAENVQSK